MHLPQRIQSFPGTLGIPSGIAVLLLCSYACSLGPTSSVAAVPTSEHLFLLQSEMWFNLNHFLYQQARARIGESDAAYPAVMGARSDTVGYGTMTDAERTGWERALQYYVRQRASRDIDFDSELVETNYALAGKGDGDLRAGPGLPSELVAALKDAAPAYRHIWWARHDGANREFVTRMRASLAKYGNGLASALVRVYRVPWPREPVPVEVVAYANWAGAYTTIHPTLITIASLYAGTSGSLGVDLLFHESSHAMMDSVDIVLKGLGMSRGTRETHDLEHAIIFYTAGEVVRHTVAGAVPYYEWRGVFDERRGFLVPYYAPLLIGWRPYLNGQGSLQTALERVVANLRPRPVPNGTHPQTRSYGLTGTVHVHRNATAQPSSTP